MECHGYKSNLSHQVEKSEEERRKQRKRNLLLLVLDYLESNGYLSAAAQLRSELGAYMRDYEVCDNVNLEIILQDYEAYYFIRYQTHAKLIRKTSNFSRKEEKHTRTKRIKPRLPTTCYNSQAISNCQDQINTEEPRFEWNSCLVHPLGPYSNLEINNEWRILAEVVCKEILIESPNVLWQDIIGHEHVKQGLKEALVYPIKYPGLYSIVKPWRGLFLYGPTGTGKTMLAKAAASQCKATFFNVSPSTFTSKWRGESEKLIKVLFELATAHAPSIIFLDEVDSLMTHRLAQEHEASRRFKSEILAQIEGLSLLKQSVFILAASNFPWDIDFAMLRRMEQRIYVSLPDLEERSNMVKQFLPPKIESDGISIKTKLDYDKIATLTEGYSGADLQLLSKEIKMQSIRNAIQSLESSSEKFTPNLVKVTVPVIETEGVIETLSKIKPLHSTLMDKYKDFSACYGTL